MKLLVIDIQKGITDSRLFNFDEFIDNTSRIIQAARDNQIEVIYFQHDDGLGTGFSIGDEEFEIAEQVHPREGEKIFTKNINSCDACASIPCGLAVRKQHEMLFAASKVYKLHQYLSVKW